MDKEKLLQLRHSASHILAQAVLHHFPDAKLAIGPAIDEGFYYDFDLGEKTFNEEDLEKIEKTMTEIVKQNQKFEQLEKPVDEAIEFLEKADQPYKVELAKEFKARGDNNLGFNKMIDSKGEEYFIDLCAGNHVRYSKEVKAFKLLRIAGAYWRGDEKNKMLQRIYGVAFASKPELEEYLKMLEEAEKRNHKRLGKELELFMFHETSPGMPYWLPKGLILYKELEDYWRVEHAKLGYLEISSPLVNKSELWKTSGHWDHYKDDMFIADMGDNEVYGIKPMNCPNAMVVFKSMQVSYRDLPFRLSDTDRLHRYERSGTLNGLLRCRSFQQDDSHNYVSEDMIEDEYAHIMQICKEFYGIFNLEYHFRLGTRPEGYLGDLSTWEKAEASLKRVLEKSGKEYSILEGDGAFYGPKIDIVMKDAIGRDWQMGTMQLDFHQPRRFELEYTDKDGTKKTPVVIHRVVYGSLERFIGILIEHFAGAFPLWLSPVQVQIVAVGEDFNDYCHELANEFREQGIRAEVDDADETVGNKIRKAEKSKSPYMLVVGEKEKSSGNLTVRKRGSRDMVEYSKDDFITQVVMEIKTRML